MKTKLVYLLTALALIIGTANAQKVVRVSSNNYDISDNLDLEAVASLFGKSKNLSVFEKRLNEPKRGISNLDLNEDGYVDYLRVIETSLNGDYLVIIQAVLDEDIFQDVATIEVTRAERDNYSVVVIGNEYLYGMNYYICPVYSVRPLIFGFFYEPQHYRPWYSPYHWGYYPNWYKHRRPYSVHHYHRHIMGHIDYNNHYDRPNSWERHHHWENEYHKYGRNDYGSRHPEKSFNKRNNDYRNSHDLNTRREAERPSNRAYRNNESSRPVEQGNRRYESKNRRNNENTPSSRRSYSTQEQQRRGSVERERPANAPSQNKSEKVRQPESRKVESSPARREQPEPQRVNRRSTENEKSVSEKPQKVQQKETKVEKVPERRESKAAETKKTEKIEKKEIKKAENSDRR